MLDSKEGQQTALIIVNAIAPYCFELNNFLAMPQGFNYRFRYRRFWMPTIGDPKELEGLPLLIILRIFESGELIPLREATVERISEVGDVVHIEYRLGEIMPLPDDTNLRSNQILGFTRATEKVLGEYSNVPGKDLRNLVLIADRAGLPTETWPDPRFPHRTEYDFRIQEGAGRCRGASIRKRR